MTTIFVIKYTTECTGGPHTSLKCNNTIVIQFVVSNVICYDCLGDMSEVNKA